MVSKILRIGLPMAILLIGAFLTFVLLNHREPPFKQEIQKIIPRVEILETKPHNGSILIESHGIIEADAVFSIASQVSGRVIWVHPDMKEGKKINKGEILFRIDPTEYELAVEQARADLVSARYDLDLVRAKQNAAIQEYQSYKQMGKDSGSSPSPSLSPLAKYEPQVESAISALNSVKAGLKIAELNLERTIVYAPEIGSFRSVSVNPGQIVVANETVAKLIKIQPVVIKVPIPLSDIDYLDFESDSEKKSSLALISKNMGIRVHQWQGKVKRIMSEMDSTSRNALVFIEIDHVISNHGLELPVGLFVNVTLKGKMEKNRVKIPLQTVRNGSTVWIVNNENKLEIRDVKIEKLTNTNAFISSGLNYGEKLVTSSITAPIQGLDVSIFDQNQSLRLVKKENRGVPVQKQNN